MADLTSDSLCGVCSVLRNRSGGIRSCSLGCSVEGGTLIYKEGGVAWIIAPCTTQVIRDWYNRNDALTLANATCGDWFIPSAHDMYVMAYSWSFWDSSISARYWSDTEEGCCQIGVCCCALYFCICTNGQSINPVGLRKNCSTISVRAIRKVYY
jgi:hypothetical protein